MGLFPAALMLSIAASADSFVIGIGFGLKGVRIGFFSNLYISLVCFGGTAAAMLLGQFVGEALPVWLARGIGAAVLWALGLWMLADALRPNRDSLHGICTDADCVDKDHSKKVELSESITIGLVLALNNMGLGMGAGISGLPVLLTSALCSAASFTLLSGGCRLGKKLVSGRLSKILETASALLVIWLGVRSVCAF